MNSDFSLLSAFAQYNDFLGSSDSESKLAFASGITEDYSHVI